MLATKAVSNGALRQTRPQEIQPQYKTYEREQAKTSSKEKWKWMGVMFLCTAVLLGLVYQYSSIARTNLDVERIKIKIDQQTESSAKLNDKINELSGPNRIMTIARDKLKMTPVPPTVEKNNHAAGSGQ